MRGNLQALFYFPTKFGRKNRQKALTSLEDCDVSLDVLNLLGQAYE